MRYTLHLESTLVAGLIGIFARRRELLRQQKHADAKMRQAMALVEDARQQALDARSIFENERGPGALPNGEKPEDIDRQLISALDHYHQVHTTIDLPFREARDAWENSLVFRRHLTKSAHVVRAIFVRTSRVLFIEQLNQLGLALTAITKVLQSRLTDNALRLMAEHSRSRHPDEALGRYRMNNASFIAALDRLNFYVSPSSTDAGRGIHGGLPASVAEKVEASPLLQGPLLAILRRYQDFGARYLIVQKRTLLGDDMGLGKTVQVLAAMSHLHALGGRHFLVVAPNSVLINWQRETRKHTLIEPFIAHGSDREENINAWREKGGVAITTYGTLSKILDLIPMVDFVAIDEAHYVKNPESQRSQAVQLLVERSEYVTLMTGTALENRLPEMHFLLSLAQPEVQPVLEHLMTFYRGNPDPTEICKDLAPVYLRRTQKDVLHELPERIVEDEWIELHDDDQHFYLHATSELMIKRLAATIGNGVVLSSKYQRLLEVVEEHLAEKRKIVVFSFFRQVIDDVCALFPGTQQITGSTSSTRRQEILDSFTQEPDQVILVMQVDAGGIGINLQSAQVVILMEPQMKPSTEWQAIARVHRMGQSKTVLVHRLIARDTIDERMVELVEQKTQVFMDYANDSAVRDASFMAKDGRNVDVEGELRKWLDSK
jgi:SNF2 family DNA or RNA helicase